MERNSEIMVSVVMLCYNHEKYIRKAIESVINQNASFEYEIIIHDDASTDRSAEIIKEYESQYPEKIKAIYQKENIVLKEGGGLYKYIDPFIRGKYVARCECDDYWCSSDKLQKQVKLLEEHPEYICCTHNCNIIDDEDNIISNSYNVYHFCKTHVFDIKRFECGLFPGQTAAKVTRRTAELFDSKEQESDYHAIRCQGDQKQALHLLLNGNIMYLDDVLSSHRVVRNTGSSWTARTNGKDMALYMFLASRDLRHYAKKYYNYTLHNHYVTFHRGLHIVFKRFGGNDTAKEDYRKMVDEIGNSFKTIAYILYMGVRAFPYCIIQKILRNRFDLK